MVTEIYTNNPSNTALLADALVARSAILRGSPDVTGDNPADVEHLLGARADEILTGTFNASVNGRAIEIPMCTKPIEMAVNDAMAAMTAKGGSSAFAPAPTGHKH